MRTDYRICPSCGAALDPGERCDCRTENKEAASGAANTESGQKVNEFATLVHLHDTRNRKKYQRAVFRPKKLGKTIAVPGGAMMRRND